MDLLRVSVNAQVSGLPRLRSYSLALSQIWTKTSCSTSCGFGWIVEHLVSRRKQHARVSLVQLPEAVPVPASGISRAVRSPKLRRG